ncbi:MAG: hypothetical protein J0I45_16575 [Bosea sp.]|nr:hypothetical protein [Bosea sp. (in: a-proteobacteria)]
MNKIPIEDAIRQAISRLAHAIANAGYADPGDETEWANAAVEDARYELLRLRRLEGEGEKEVWE